MTTLIAFTAGCGGSGGGPGTSGGSPTSPTAVTLMLSSTANDQLQQFGLQLQSLSLTGKSGTTVSLVSTPPYTGLGDFIHLNGFSEPVLTVSIPQDTYTSATATVGGSEFTCVNLNPSGDNLETSTFAYGSTPANQVTVDVPQAIDVDSVPMGLSLNLQVSPSVAFSSCDPNGIEPYSINPTFDLIPIEFGNPNNALVSTQATTLQGVVGNVDTTGSSFTTTTADGTALNVTVPAGTSFQGASGLAALVPGAPVEMDLDIGENGSISATRVQFLDPTPTNLSLVTGALVFVSNAESSLFMNGTQAQGYLAKLGELGGTQPFSFGSAAFQVSGYLGNFAKLPFAPVFNAQTMVPGQNIAITTHATSIQGGPTYEPATTVTLKPQTVDGIVTGIATTGSGTSTVTAYTISLAPYDLFPDLAVQPGQTTLLTNPGIMTIYTVGGAVGMQNIAVASPFRFTGLVFNDNGSLKMDCLQILAGVSE